MRRKSQQMDDKFQLDPILHEIFKLFDTSSREVSSFLHAICLQGREEANKSIIHHRNPT